MGGNVKKFAECIYDITSVACSVLYADKDNPNADTIDSRDLFERIFWWAKVFMDENPDPVDYMLEIEMFAYRMLREDGLMPEGGEDDDCV